MKVEILYFDGCPTYIEAEETLKGVLADEGVEAEVEMVAVNTDEEAQRLHFPGSPTIRVDGGDLFPAGEREDWRMGCRVYATHEGLKGYSTAGMLKEALKKGSSERVVISCFGVTGCLEHEQDPPIEDRMEILLSTPKL